MSLSRLLCFATSVVLLVSCATAAPRDIGQESLYVERRGKGPAVVFLSGLLGSTRYWQSVDLSAIERRRTLLFVDALGLGRSPRPPVSYTLDEHLDALRRTLVSEGATNGVIIVAHSFGAILAAHYAARYPDEIDHLFLLGTPLYSDEREARELVRATSQLAAMQINHPRIAMIICRTHEMLRPLLRRVAIRRGGDLPPEVAEDSLLHNWRSVDGSVRNVVLGAPIEPTLRVIGAKVTFVHGDTDRVTAIARIQRVARVFGAAVIITNNDHRRYHGEAMARVIDQIDRRHTPE